MPGSPTMRSMFPLLVGLGSPSIFEENVSSITRDLKVFHDVKNLSGLI